MIKKIEILRFVPEPYESVVVFLRSFDSTRYKFKNENDKNILSLLSLIKDCVLWSEGPGDGHLPLETYEKSILSLLNIGDIKVYLDNPVGDTKGIEVKLKLISAALRLNRLPALYSFAEFKEFFELDSSGVDQCQLVQTAIEFMRGKEQHDLFAMFFEDLKSDNLLKNISDDWLCALWSIIICNVLFVHWYIHPLEQQQFILQHLFFNSVLAGVPVREKMAEALYETRTPIAFVALCKVYLDALQSNDEIVSDEKNKNIKTLGSFFDQYIKFSGKDFVSKNKQKEFVNLAFPEKSNKFIYYGALAETLSIYVGTKNCDLVDRNRGGELSDADLYHNDLVTLLSFSAIGLAGEEKISKYYKQDNPRVPVTALLRDLAKNVKLEGVDVIQNFVELNMILHKNHLIPENQDIIIFDESDNQFHWNESAFV